MKTLFLALISAIAITGGAARAQEPPKAHEHEHAQPPAVGEQKADPRPMPGMAGMPGMMGMMKSMEARDKKLDALVAELNAAKGNDRTDTLVALVNELVAERKTMSAMCAEHMTGMMKNK